MRDYLYNLNEAVINGEKNPLEVYVELKGLEKLLKDVISAVQPDAIDEAEKYGKGEHDAYGAKFQVKNGAGRWSFKGNPEWVDAEAKKKAIEEQLKTLFKGGVVGVDESTGEMIKGAEFTPGKTTIAVRL